MTKKYVFTLAGLNISSINKRYNLPNDLKIYDNNQNEDHTSVTKITEITKKQSLTFVGDNKQKCTCEVSMIDFKSGSSVNILRYNCFWCRNPFSSMSIGCPIKFVPAVLSLKYNSIVADSEYEIFEDLNACSNTKTNITQTSTSHYQTDGVFCSFNCCKSFIDDNLAEPMYKNSNVLITKLYNDLYKANINTISPAPHWRTLIQYGGFLNINDFRESFDKIEYKNHGFTREFLQSTQPLGVLFEKKIKF